MKMYGKIENAIILTRKREESKKESGLFYYKIGILFPKEQELGEVNCNEDIYKASEIYCGDVNKKVNLDFVYNTDFKNISICALTPVKVAK